jgi:hypothetical protein
MALCKFCAKSGWLNSVDENDLCGKCRRSVGDAMPDYKRAWHEVTKALRTPSEMERLLAKRATVSQSLLASITEQELESVREDMLGNRTLGHPYDDRLRKSVEEATRLGYLILWARLGSKAPDTSAAMIDADKFFHGSFDSLWEMSGVAGQAPYFQLACVFYTRTETEALRAAVPKLRDLNESADLRLRRHLMNAMLGGFLLADREARKFDVLA